MQGTGCSTAIASSFDRYRQARSRRPPDDDLGRVQRVENWLELRSGSKAVFLRMLQDGAPRWGLGELDVFIADDLDTVALGGPA